MEMTAVIGGGCEGFQMIGGFVFFALALLGLGIFSSLCSSE